MMNIIFAGVGGQGIVLASKLVAAAALHEGHFVRAAETIGMAQRGGSVVSHVRFTTVVDEVIASSLIPLQAADLIISFEPGEAIRALPFLKSTGAIVSAQAAQIPVNAALIHADYDGSEARDYLIREKGAVIVDGEAICDICGSPRVVNVSLLGAAFAAGFLHLQEESIEHALMTLVKPRFLEINQRAFSLGMQYSSGIRS
jgi:indolepyruvate ferredoxin oxidoreductase, beta subunit